MALIRVRCRLALANIVVRRSHFFEVFQHIIELAMPRTELILAIVV